MSEWASVLGLDLSLTGTGIVTMGSDGTVLAARTVGWSLERKAPYDRRIERVLAIALAVQRAYQEAPQPCGVCIENFAFRAHGAQNDLGELHGIVKAQLWLAGRVWPRIPTASSVRKAVCGNGGIKKAAVLPLVRAVWPDVADDDQADAWVLAAFWWSEQLGAPGWTRIGPQQELALKRKAGRNRRKGVGDGTEKVGGVAGG